MTTLAPLPEVFTNPPGRRIGCVALILNGGLGCDTDVLLVKSQRGKWILPGGHAESNEAPTEALVRNVYREIGVRVRPVHFAALDQIVTNPEEGAAEGYNIVLGCEGVPESTEIKLGGDVTEYAYVPLSQLESYALPYQERRVRAAVHAWESGTTALLMGGYPALPIPA